MLRGSAKMGILLSIAGVMAFFVWVPPSFADFVDVFLFTDNRCSACPFPGYAINVFTDFQDPLGLGDVTSVHATPINGNLPAVGLPFSPPPVGDIFTFQTVFPNNNYSGTYQITVNTQSSGTFTINTHTLDHPQQLPFLNNFSIDNNGTTPAVHFTMPSVSIPSGYGLFERVDIFTTPAQTGDLVFQSPNLFLSAGDQGTVQIPDGVLIPGDSYFIRASLIENEPGTGTDIVGARENRSIIGETLVATPEPSSLALVSSAVPGLLGYGWLRRRKAAGRS